MVRKQSTCPPARCGSQPNIFQAKADKNPEGCKWRELLPNRTSILLESEIQFYTHKRAQLTQQSFLGLDVLSAFKKLSGGGRSELKKQKQKNTSIFQIYLRSKMQFNQILTTIAALKMR